MTMKRRYLILLFTMFFMFLYIGPVNLLPSSIPPAIVQQNQDTKDEPKLQDSFLIADEYEISVVLAADIDDDWWNIGAAGPTHFVTSTASQILWNSADYIYVGQQRFSLAIPQGAIIVSANLTAYQTADPFTYTNNIWRIDEDNVGSLEGDGTPPSIAETTVCYSEWDTNADEWNLMNVTDLVQEQINLEGWISGNYIGFRHGVPEHIGSYNFQLEDYQHADSHLPYMNITYTSEEVVPYGQDWLMGWGRRQQHNITQTAGTGANYTVPLYVWNGLGTSWVDNGYVSGYAQDDFDDIRFTQNNGSTELEYQLNTTWDEEITDYMSNDSVGFGAYPANYPSSIYYNGRTYISRQGPDRDPYITYYDHENNTWGGWYRAGNNSVLNALSDGHGAPALFVDDGGYIHVFYGGHANLNNIQHTKSDLPEDLTAWTAQPEIDWGWGSTYPHLYYDATNDLLHLYVRTEQAGNYRWIQYRNSTDKGLTWSSAWYIVELSDASPYFNVGEMDVTNTSISLSFKRYPYGDGDDNIYYIRANFTSKTVYNASGYSLGETVTDAELPDCLVFDTSGCNVWSPDVHLDENDVPYLMWIVGQTPGDVKGEAMFTYWTGSSWASIDNITQTWAFVGGHDFIVYDSTNITAFISEGTSISKNMTEFSWDGDTWTRVGVIVEGGTRFVSFNIVPMYHDDEIQVTFTEQIGNDEDMHMWAYGSDGIVQYTWPKHALFYVRVPDDLTATDATIYLYYANSAVSTTENATMEIDTGNDPVHGAWGVEEEDSNENPVNEQAPVCVNLDDTDNLYAKYREYQITANVSDGDGFADLYYLEISLYFNDRGSLYWTIRFTEDTGVFSEQSDTSNMITLNTTGSTNQSSGNTLNVTFHLTVHWNHTDITDTDIKQYVTDDHPATDTDWYEVNYDVETRLDFSSFSLNDGLGTPDRGDYDTLDGIVASGTVDYYGSAISPDSTEVDVWVSCSDVEGGPWSDTTLVDGVFSVTVDSDNVVGLDTYSFIVVEKGDGVGGSDLNHASHSDTYIADRLIIDIQADDETPFNEQQVNFTLTVIYDYDDTVCSTYTIVVSRNTVWWHTFINGNATLFNDTNSDVAYVYTTYDISESTYGLTEYSSGSESVIWSGEATTTPPTTTTLPTTSPGIFYDLFLSLDMWGYLGPLGLVVVGYVLAKKDRGLGVIAFMVQCLFVAQYLALVSATPDYWWHVFIILFGGIFTCVVPLMDKR